MLIPSYLTILLLIAISRLDGLFASDARNLRLNTTIAFPNVTITCTIDKISPVISTFLICPHKQYCFINCEKYCKKCNIKCNIMKFGSGPNGKHSYTYTFRGTDKSNWGEWGCNYGREKVVTSFKLKEKAASLYNKRHIKVEKVDRRNITDFKGHTKAHQVSGRSKVTAKPGLKAAGNKKTNNTQTGLNGRKPKSIVKAEYVILMLIILTVSLAINIWLVIREILAGFSKKAMLPEKSNSTCFRCVTRCFCVHDYSSRHNPVTSNGGDTITGSSILHQHLISRQSSQHNTYDYSPFMSPPGAIWASQQLGHPNIYSATPTMDNHAYLGTPMVGYPHAGIPSAQVLENAVYARSKSFPVRQDVPDGETVRSSTNQLIYDDVPEPSINVPVEPNVMNAHFGTIATSGLPGYRMSGFSPVNGMMTQSQANYLRSIQRQASLQPRRPGTASLYSQSMINLENTVEMDANMSTSEAALKDAISSRVELSKEMISQADNLLRKADMILSHNAKSYDEPRQNSMNAHNNNNKNETSPTNSVNNN